MVVVKGGAVDVCVVVVETGPVDVAVDADALAEVVVLGLWVVVVPASFNWFTFKFT